MIPYGMSGPAALPRTALDGPSTRGAGIPVLHTLKTAEQEPGGRQTGLGHPRLPGGEDFRGIADGIRPQVGDSVLVARRFSAFAGTRLRRRLAESGRDQPVIVGVFARRTGAVGRGRRLDAEHGASSSRTRRPAGLSGPYGALRRVR